MLVLWTFFFSKTSIVELVLVRFRGINLHVKFQLHDVHELWLNLKEGSVQLFYGLSWRLDSTRKTIWKVVEFLGFFLHVNIGQCNIALVDMKYHMPHIIHGGCR
jgi:hypothetical protein